MRSQAIFLLAVWLCTAGEAVHARSFISEGSPSSRRLQQFSTCPAGCAPGACVATSTDGQVTCIGCTGDNVVLRTDGTCHCPLGYYANSTDCLPCPKGKFCPGGLYNGTGSPVSYDCPPNMTTRGMRGSSVLSCVNMRGFFYVYETVAGNPSPRAVICPIDTYGRGFRKQQACVPCPPGYTTSNATGRGSMEDCELKEGLFSNGFYCPMGEYQSGDNATAGACTKCPAGVTTKNAGSVSITACTEVLPTLYAAGMTAGYVNETRTCPHKYYCPGGTPQRAVNLSAIQEDSTIIKCPNGMWTQAPGASADHECLTPPGFYTAGSMTQPCQTGSYRPGWKPSFESTACLPCGDGVLSVDNDQLVDYTPTGAASVVNVRTSSSICYITAGQGMQLVDPTANPPIYKAENCDNDSYGVVNTTLGLGPNPCRKCPNGMQARTSLTESAIYWVNITGRQGFTSPLACVTLPGWGYNGRDASRCPVGSYNPGGNRDPCTSCPYGRTTRPGGPEVQLSLSDCYIAPGFGRVSNAGEDIKIELCKIGTYNDGLRQYDNINVDKCKSCDPDRSPLPTSISSWELSQELQDGIRITTTQPGARSFAECDQCSAGYGSPAVTSSTGQGIACGTPCGGGTGSNATYGPLGRHTTTPGCVSCPPMTVGFTYFFNGSIQPFAPPIYARQFATSPAHCVAEFAQIVDGAWFIGGNASMTAQTTATTFDACVQVCRASSTCQYITFDYETRACWMKTVVTAAFYGPQSSCSGSTCTRMSVTAFKAVVGGDVTASSTNTNTIKASAVASGLYSYWRDHGDWIGATRKADGPVNDVAACMSACDDKPECAGVAMRGVRRNRLEWSNPPGPEDPPESWVGTDLTSCTLIIGDSDVSSSRRSVTKAALGMCNRLNVLALTSPPSGC